MKWRSRKKQSRSVDGCFFALLNMPWKIRFEILIFPCGGFPTKPFRSFTILRLLFFVPRFSFLFPRQVPRTGEKIRSGLRLNACVSIVKPADMADSIVLNFYLMYPPILRGSFVFLRLSSFRLFVVLLPPLPLPLPRLLCFGLPTLGV